MYNPKRRRGLSPKLQQKWEGPYTVVKKLNEVVYKVQRSPNAKPKVIPINRLAPYRATDHSSKIPWDNMSLKAHGKASIDLTKSWIGHQAATRKSRNQKKEGDITSHPFFTSPSHLAERTRRSTCVPPVAIHTLLNRNLF
ncbi:hypothetical protein AVEN_210498-1 [Araneus ventricosus]|uniref:Integrase p58-like C-terminal domain-containing protein n=1 Tax=Araneus ventricosus TaxID=182803 RepID=A0A4Y2FES8_ARAVE|nr:hypothetical protein AVEN_210498-1 [Araneus ventricosus]